MTEYRPQRETGYTDEPIEIPDGAIEIESAYDYSNGRASERTQVTVWYLEPVEGEQ